MDNQAMDREIEKRLDLLTNKLSSRYSLSPGYPLWVYLGSGVFRIKNNYFNIPADIILAKIISLLQEMDSKFAVTAMAFEPSEPRGDLIATFAKIAQQ